MVKGKKLSQNVKKAVIFKSRKLKIGNSFKFKLDNKILVPTKSVKCLVVIGVFW